MSDRSYIRMRSNTERERLLAAIEDQTGITSDSKAIDFAMKACLQLIDQAEQEAQDLRDERSAWNTSDDPDVETVVKIDGNGQVRF